MRTVQITDAQRDLPELIYSAAAGEEIIITRNNRPVARLVSSPASSTSLRDIQPTSVGAVLQFDPPDNDLLSEMLGQGSALIRHS